VEFGGAPLPAQGGPTAPAARAGLAAGQGGPGRPGRAGPSDAHVRRGERLGLGGVVALTEGRVRFRWRDYADGDRVKVMDLDVHEFLRGTIPASPDGVRPPRKRGARGQGL
jgi:hypothetical protein